MAEKDVQDGEQTFERIGRACDELNDLSRPALADAIAGRTRQLRGLVKAHHHPRVQARKLLDLADESEKLVEDLRRINNERKDNDAQDDLDDADRVHDDVPAGELGPGG